MHFSQKTFSHGYSCDGSVIDFERINSAIMVCFFHLILESLHSFIKYVSKQQVEGVMGIEKCEPIYP